MQFHRGILQKVARLDVTLHGALLRERPPGLELLHNPPHVGEAVHHICDYSALNVEISFHSSIAGSIL